MKITPATIDGVLIIEPRCFQDQRGLFMEAWHDERYREAGIAHRFIQDNHSRSVKGVLRGLHFQISRPQAKLLTVIRGRVFDAGVDLRHGSRTFGQWFGVELSDDGPRQLYLPPGFAHGFCVLSDWADVYYKVSERYDPSDEGGVRWNDPDLGIEWPTMTPIVGARDAAFPRLRALSRAQLPQVAKE